VETVKNQFWYSLLVILMTNHVFAGEKIFNSGIKQTVLIELYTSEGCSSCPPAENYLNKFVQNSQLWKKYIPLAFHVDYWDYLGWKDKYADPLYTTRQRQHAAINSARTIYTPGFFVNGRTWRMGFFNSLPSPDTQAVGNLQVKYKQGIIHAEFQPESKTNELLELNVAVLGMGITSNIVAGENEGRFSSHDFVVLGYGKTQGAQNHWKVKQPVLKNIKASRYALVAWLSQPGIPEPLQATGGFIEISKNHSAKADL